MKGKVLLVSLWNKINFKNNAPTQFFEAVIHNSYHASHYALLSWRPLSLWNTSCFSGFPHTHCSVIIGATSTVTLISHFRDHILFFSGINNSVIYTIIITITITKNYWTFSGIIQTHHTFFHNSNENSPYSDKIQEGWHALYRQHTWVIKEMCGRLIEYSNGKIPLMRIKHTWDDNRKIILKKQGVNVQIGLIWVRRSKSKLLECGNESMHSLKANCATVSFSPFH